MLKIPTLFVRDPEDRSRVLNQISPGCEWVVAGEGRPTRKLDGTAVMYDQHGAWWARREVKAGKAVPPGYITVQHDETTGKLAGWEPVAQSPFAKFHAEAVANAEAAEVPWIPWQLGTYELIGPKINGNPERYDRHWLVAHTNTETLPVDFLTFDGIRASVLRWHKTDHVEGIVWHHPDGRRAKIKARDFATPEPQQTAVGPADELRTAARKLRARLADPELTPGPWLSMDRGDRLLYDGPGADTQPPVYVVDEPMSNGANADYIATMHPGVGHALARLFAETADHMDLGSGAPGHPVIDPTVALAYMVLGGEQR
ncbi:DUF5565 family protein [Streptomyces prunicolor]|uniref:RNA ligase 1 family protein n=1 Tax=Streptomyces prunicolor TaxID=67348 RepID=UPI0022525E96|nr:DUF5565 family protein [Streptomyces prunicolor]MCX5239758.1 DUF5565 family protein [Streptomyces prunicolor]